MSGQRRKSGYRPSRRRANRVQPWHDLPSPPNPGYTLMRLTSGRDTTGAFALASRRTATEGRTVMAIGVLFECPGATQAQDEAAARKLTNGGTLKTLSDWPVKGLMSHVAGPTPNGWRVMDVWESEADLNKFAAVLMPILKEVGFPDIAPQVFPAHNFVKS